MKTAPVLEQQGNDGDTIGGRIWRARDSAGLTIAHIANQAGVRKETVAQWERDRSEPRANKLVMLAGILGVSPTWLMTGAGEGPTEPNDIQASSVAPIMFEIKRLQAELGNAIRSLEQHLQNSTT